jgi:hypothetical protein
MGAGEIAAPAHVDLQGGDGMAGQRGKPAATERLSETVLFERLQDPEIT